MRRLFLTVILLGSITFGFSQSITEDFYLNNLVDNTFRFDTSKLIITDNSHSLNVEEAWKQWQLVENYAYGKDRGSLPMITDLKSLHPYFRDKIIALIAACQAQGIEVAVVESFRTRAKQAEYFGMGRNYTRSKGGKSKHQYGLAVDIVPIVDSVAVWDNHVLWKKIGVLGEKLGLRWGGRWRAPYDPAHFEWGGGVTTTQLANGISPYIPKSKIGNYPCLDEELAMLEKHYQAWEVEQALTARQTTIKSSRGSSGQ